jgi:hypothetical protein
MSISPRDAGIPMLTEVIEEEGMDFVGPLPDEAETAASAEAAQAPALPELQPALPVPPPPAGGGYAPQGRGIQYGPPAQFAPSYPLPLKPAASAPPAAVAEPLAERAASAAPGPAAAGLPPPAPISEDEWQRMERRVRERILGQLLSRTDAMLEERIRSSVAGVLEQAVDGLAATLRASLHKTLEDVVSRAVAQEISRLQSTKK